MRTTIATITTLLALTGPAVAADEATDAVRALKRLRSATHAGVNQSEYGRRLVDTKIAVDEYLDTPPRDDAALRQGVRGAMRLYEVAGQAWNQQVTGARSRPIPLPGGIDEAVYLTLEQETRGSASPACTDLHSTVESGLRGHATRDPSYRDSTIVAPGYGIGIVPKIWACGDAELQALPVTTQR